MTTLEDLRLKRIAVPIRYPIICGINQGKQGSKDRINHPMITELVWGRDYFVRTVELPSHIAGVSSVLPDGTYNIYLNAKLAIEIQWEAFLHELLHCEAGHFDEWKDLPIEIKEWEADHLRPAVVGEDVV